MEEAEVQALLEESRCLECLFTGQLDYVEAFLLSEWAGL